MDFIIIILAFFFALLMCLGLILIKWIISQLGATLFFMVLFLAVSILLLSMGDQEHDDE